MRRALIALRAVRRFSAAVRLRCGFTVGFGARQRVLQGRRHRLRGRRLSGRDSSARRGLSARHPCRRSHFRWVRRIAGNTSSTMSASIWIARSRSFVSTWSSRRAARGVRTRSTRCRSWNRSRLRRPRAASPAASNADTSRRNPRADHQRCARCRTRARRRARRALAVDSRSRTRQTSGARRGARFLPERA